MDSNKRPENMERITSTALAEAFIEEQLKALREQIGDRKVLLALSGGVDSSVVAALLIKAVGKQLVCVHVNHGLLRKGEPEQVVRKRQSPPQRRRTPRRPPVRTRRANQTPLQRRSKSSRKSTRPPIRHGR